MNVLNHFLLGASDILLGYGLQGVVMVGSWYSTYKIYQRNVQLSDQRFTDAQAMSKAIDANTAALNRMADGLVSATKH